MARTLTWLHLSDLHARLRTDWDSRQITDSLVRDLKSMQKVHGLRPDFIFLTGDVVFGAVSGENMTDQYQLAKNFLDAVRKAFEPEIQIRDLYLVPGNHDVDRCEITPDQTEWLRHSDRKLPDILSAMQDGKKQWRTWMDRLANYRNFLTTYGLLHLAPDDPHLIYGDAREIHGIRVGIAGLNTAWSCADNEDKAKLWFGADWQIPQVKQRMGPVNFEFVLFHHPVNWFTAHEDPDTMRRLRQEFAVVLHGHEHKEWVEPDSEGRLVLSAGACYESSWMANGYNFGFIDLDQQQGGIRLRQWDSTGHGWVPRNVANKTHDGLWTLPHLPWINSSGSEALSGIADRISTGDDSQAESGESAEGHYTRRYCQHIIDQHDVLELFGCDIPRELQRHQLSVAYVSLNLAPEDEEEPLLCPFSVSEAKSLKIQPESEPDAEQENNIENSSAAIEFVLDRISENTGRLLINGPAGAGKSTLMRWCAIHAAQQILINTSCSTSDFDIQYAPLENKLNTANSTFESGGWRRKIPLLIRLRDCPTGQLPAAKDLPNFLAKHLPSAPTNWMTDVLDSGQAIILFDGVDEVHRDQRPQLAEEISELIRTYPDCIYVVTTRPGAVEAGWLARLNFTEAHVEPMSRRDREEFIDKWYRSAALELKQRPRPGENLVQTAARLKVELVEQPELGILATNPLLCAMICALYRERQEKLPETPAELSEALCNMLLHRRERETPGLADKHFLPTWRALQYPQKKGLLSELAWHMMSQGDSSIDVDATKVLVAETLGSTPGRSKDEAADVVQALIERSGLLRPSSDDRIDFLHNTLKEYLAASRVVEDGDWKILADHADDPAWQPVILFALSLAPEPFSSGLVGQILTNVVSIKKTVKKAGSLTKYERKTLAADKARQFFLVRCRAVAKRLASNLSTTIDGFLKHLLPPTSMNEVEALALLGPQILTYGTTTLENVGWWARQNCHMVARCLRLLRLIGGPRAKAILKTVCGLSSYSSQVNNEWLLASCELFTDERISWPFNNVGTVSHLYLSSSAINDISRLDVLTSLRHLDLDGTAVASLSPLTGLKSLESMTLRKTLVSDITPLSELTSLQVLDLSNTFANDLSPLSGLPSLKRLVCQQNKVSNLAPLSELTSLQDLDVGGTQVLDLNPISALVSLRRLACWGTMVCDLTPLYKLTSLQELHVSRTQVSSLHPLTTLVSLKMLYLWNTMVKDLSPLAGLVALEYLDLDRTPVTDISPLAGLVSLQDLDLRATQVINLSPLAGLVSLQSINLDRTPITDISPLSGLVSLQDLHLDETAVTDLNPLAGLFSLQSLSLYGTQVVDLTPLSGLASLNYIVLKKAIINEQVLDNFKTLRPDVKIIFRK